MFGSSATFAVMVANFAHYFTTSLMQNFLPAYARDILALDLKSNGAFISVAFTCKLMSKYFLSFFADFLKSKKILSPSTSCRVFQGLASFGTVIVFALLAFYIDCTRPTAALAVLALYGLFAGSAIPGFFTSSCSFAPMYTGMISSMMEGAGALGNLLSPAFVGYFVKNGRSSEWALVFCAVIFVNLVGGTVFLLFGTAKIQIWAKPALSIKRKVILEPSITDSIKPNFKQNV
uniref:Uncharacterized protein n=1 Tax=Panagrolaimus davidi TaxID=227884 RepID=A0A914QDW5_9BILA